LLAKVLFHLLGVEILRSQHLVVDVAAGKVQHLLSGKVLPEENFTAGILTSVAAANDS